MAITQALPGFGTLFQIDPTGGTTYATIAEIVNVGDVGGEADDYEASHMESPGGWVEKVRGMIDGGSVSLELNYVPASASQQGLSDQLAVFQNQNSSFRIVLPTTPSLSITFGGYIKTFRPNIQSRAKMTLSVVITVSGPISFPT